MSERRASDAYITSWWTHDVPLEEQPTPALVLVADWTSTVDDHVGSTLKQSLNVRNTLPLRLITSNRFSHLCVYKVRTYHRYQGFDVLREAFVGQRQTSACTFSSSHSQNFVTGRFSVHGKKSHKLSK